MFRNLFSGLGWQPLAVLGVVVVFVLSLVIARCERDRVGNEREQRDVNVTAGRNTERAEAQTETIANVEKSNEAVATPDPDRDERLRNRFDRTRAGQDGK